MGENSQLDEKNGGFEKDFLYLCATKHIVSFLLKLHFCTFPHELCIILS
jgi:hypothetical protein